ncbi:M48 family metallopeptidase [Papillibacter cinnamivorans]|uniref:YgjP-like metallopeptidase domain-containing protein n=1 Tax=Papillibacter cinnamivorans DSM 12816 TaxID=1122930 RepID=A0A1W2BWZ8_9FIRM|nr:SprT family zinc-dependent metalloprotease [Papillibacter cinnamivorans]SMC77523.1 hypothetical protein SAMN02745168_2468 [Papillibacter cinnamivorans DSM 12816]
MERKVQSGGLEIRYELIRKPVKNVNLRLRRDGTVLVSARRNVDTGRIDDFVRSKAEWIRRGLRRLAETPEMEITPEEYEDGDMLPLLGRMVPLRILRGERDSAVYDGETLTLTVKDPGDASKRARLLEKWQGEFCLQVFGEALQAAYPPFEAMGVAYPHLRIRKMKSLWGSCIPGKKTVTLSRRLIHKPFACIEAVAAHELAHFLQIGHGKEFYAVLTSAMPDYHSRRRLLNGKK